MVSAANHRSAAGGIAGRAFLGGTLHVGGTAPRRSYLRSHPPAHRESRLAVHRYRISSRRALPWVKRAAEYHAGLQPCRTSRGPDADRGAGGRGSAMGVVGNPGLPEPLMRELPLEHLEADILILGAGGAGLLAAV